MNFLKTVNKNKMNVHPYQLMAFSSALKLEINAGIQVNRQYSVFKAQVKKALGVPPRGSLSSLKKAYNQYLLSIPDESLKQKCLKLLNE